MTAADQTLLRKLGRIVHSHDLGRGWQRAVARALDVGDTKVSDVMTGMADLTASLRHRARGILNAHSRA